MNLPWSALRVPVWIPTSMKAPPCVVAIKLLKTLPRSHTKWFKNHIQIGLETTNTQGTLNIWPAALPWARVPSNIVTPFYIIILSSQTELKISTLTTNK